MRATSMMQIIAATEGVISRWGAGAASRCCSLGCALVPSSGTPPQDTWTASSASEAHGVPYHCTPGQTSPQPFPWRLTALHAALPSPSPLQARSITTSPLLHKEMRFPMPRRFRDAAAASNTLPPPAAPPSPIPDPSLAPLEPIDPFNISQQTQLVLHGRRLTGDPGSTRWGAPYYIPPALQKGVLPVLLADPWPAAQDPELRRSHAQLLVSFLRSQAPKRMTGADIMQQVHALHGPTFGSLGYVRQLLEHLRTARMIRGANNPAEQVLGPGSRGYPLLYYADKYQQEDYGAPLIIARRKEAEREAAVVHAMKRLRRRKAPYPLHRRRAHESALHYELGQVQVRQALQQQQEQRQEEEWKASLGV